MKQSLPSKKQMKAEQLKWQAEDLVNQAMRETPQYKKAVKITLKEIKANESKARNIITRSFRPKGQSPSSQRTKPKR